MSWISDLYETYNRNFRMDELEFETSRMPLPISHTTQQAQIEVFLDRSGSCISAAILDKEAGRTIIPVTEDSASRTSGICAHPLEDKLEYIAGDFEKYTGINNDKKHEAYLEELSDWCDSEFSHLQLKLVRSYVMQNRMMGDLISNGVLKVSEDGKLTNDKINNIDQKDCFVRFSVDTGHPGEETALYKNKDLFKSYIEYYSSKSGKSDLCCVSGETTVCSEKHGAKIRSAGDKAKLISANDSSGFTFRGRFYDAGQAISVGYEVSQKAHSALRWIMEKGFSIGEMRVAAWEISGKEIPEVLAGGSDEIFADDPETEEVVRGDDKAGIDEAYGIRLKKACKGYEEDLSENSRIVIMGVKAATTGRLSIPFYHRMSGSQYMENIERWYATCYWDILTRSKERSSYRYMGAPALIKIAEAAFGRRNDKLLMSTYERLLPCILLGQAIPGDIVRAAAARVCNPASFDSRAEWQSNVDVTCSMIKKWRYDTKKEEWSVSLDRNEKDRSYLFGRLLAAARKLEEVALYYDGETARSTAAERYFTQFKDRPVETWEIIRQSLQPYTLKLKAKGRTYYEKEIMEISDMLDAGKFKDRSGLSGLFLLGYDSQYMDYGKHKKEEKENVEE